MDSSKAATGKRVLTRLQQGAVELERQRRVRAQEEQAQRVVLVDHDAVILGGQRTPDVRLAQAAVGGDQTVAAQQPEQQRLHRERAAADLRVGDDDSGLHDVAGCDLELDAVPVDTPLERTTGAPAVSDWM